MLGIFVDTEDYAKHAANYLPAILGEPGVDREKAAIGDRRTDVLHAWRKISTCLDADFNSKSNVVHFKTSETTPLEID